MSPKRTPAKHKPACKTVGGLIIPKYLFTDENCISGLSYEPTADDVFIVTYPKSGTTWMQYIVWEILNFGAPPPSMPDMLNKCAPFLEFTGVEPVKKLSPPRPIKTHIPFDIHPYSPFAKYIYVARNPKDTCISYYNHTKEMPGMYKFSDGTLDDFVECFLEGEVSYGHWFDHVLSWYVHKDDPNVLFLTYEDMKRDPGDYILKIAEFLGEEYHQRLVSEPDLLAKIVHYTSFETMKKLEFYIPAESGSVDSDKVFNVSQNEKDSVQFRKVNFFWKGKVGNYKAYLSEEQVEALNEMMENRPMGKQIAALWEK